MSKRRLLIWLGILLFCGVSGAGLVAFSGGEGDPDGAQSVQYVAVETVRLEQQRSYSRTRRFTGKVVANRIGELSFEFNGRVVQLSAEEGDAVAAGQILARLDTRKLEARRRRIAAALAGAKARLKELQVGERPQTVRIAEAKLSQLRIELKRLERRVRRLQTARKNNAVTADVLEDAVAARDSAAAQLAAAEAKLSRIREGARPETIAAQKAAVQALQASWDEADAQLQDAVMKAPFAGTISRRFVDEGAVVAPGRSVYRLVETGRLEVHVGLTTEAARRLAAGETFTIRIAGKKRPARLKTLLPELNPSTRTRTAVFTLEGSTAGNIVAGQVAEVLIEETTQQPGFWLPTTALVKGVRGLWSCFVIRPNAESKSAERTLRRVERRDVEVLYSDGDRAYVRGTISTGEEVVAGGTHRIVPGQLVEVTSPRRVGIVTR